MMLPLLTQDGHLDQCAVLSEKGTKGMSADDHHTRQYPSLFALTRCAGGWYPGHCSGRPALCRAKGEEVASMRYRVNSPTVDDEKCIAPLP